MHCFKLGAQRTDFRLIIPPADLRPSSIFSITIRAYGISDHNLTYIVSHPGKISYALTAPRRDQKQLFGSEAVGGGRKRQEVLVIPVEQVWSAAQDAEIAASPYAVP